MIDEQSLDDLSTSLSVYFEKAKSEREIEDIQSNFRLQNDVEINGIQSMGAVYDTIRNQISAISERDLNQALRVSDGTFLLLYIFVVLILRFTT